MPQHRQPATYTAADVASRDWPPGTRFEVVDLAAPDDLPRWARQVQAIAHATPVWVWPLAAMVGLILFGQLVDALA